MILIGTPHKHNAGYYLNDDRNSDGKLSEADIQTCPHCQAVIKMAEWAKAPVQNFCLKCMKPACNRDECFECVPFIQKIEEYTNALVKYQQYLKIAGLSPEPVVLILPGHINRKEDN